LREEGLITIDGHRLTVIDLASLTQLASFEKAYLARNPPIPAERPEAFSGSVEGSGYDQEIR
jgi:hypothetical protein